MLFKTVAGKTGCLESRLPTGGDKKDRGTREIPQHLGDDIS